MATARCSHLIAKGIANKVDEMWIARQPVLLSVYLHTYAPWLSRQVRICKIFDIRSFYVLYLVNECIFLSVPLFQLFKNILGPSRVKALRTGGDPYDAMVKFIISSFYLHI